MLAAMTAKEVEGFIVLGIALLAVVAWKARRRWLPSSSAHGTATFADKRDLKRAGMLAGKGLLLGRMLDKHGTPIYMPRLCHAAIFAPTGAGKGVSFLTVWMLGAWKGARIIFDPKGDVLEKVKAKCLALCRKILVISPFSPGGCSFNPLDLIPFGRECIDYCRALAEAVVQRTGEEKDPHWNDRAVDVITAILVYICFNFRGTERSLSSLREIITSPGMYEGCAKGLIEMGGVFARLGGSMLSLEDKERASVLSTVHRHTNWLDSAPILEATQSGIDARELLSQDVDLFITLPPNQLIAQARWGRCVLASLLHMIGEHGMAKGRTCLLLMDEAGQLGHMQPLEQGLTLLRSAGLRMVFFFQSLGQLKEVFREKETVLLDNTDHLFFGARDATAKHVSERLGNYTESAQNYSENTNRSDQYGFGKDGQTSTVSGGSSISVSVHARALMTPDEVERLPDNVVIAFLRGLPPVVCRRVLYYADPLFQRFTLLRRLGKRLILSALVAVGMTAALAFIQTQMKGETKWQPKSNPAPSPTWPRK